MTTPQPDNWTLYGQTFHSRLLIGSALYPSPAVMREAITASGSEVITVSLRRQSPSEAGGEGFWQQLKSLNKTLLPNTAGCHSVKEAVTLAQMSRELFETDWLKLEVVGDDYNLQPDPLGTVEAAEQLIKLGFKVFPYCTDDLVICQRLRDVGCQVLMPWGSAEYRHCPGRGSGIDGASLSRRRCGGPPSHLGGGNAGAADCLTFNADLRNAVLASAVRPYEISTDTGF